ncbi:MAG TPA: CDP-alcohol phosphatidyltransferase family protein [Kofleriaceae bacterium]|jgi:cardiolipin synthase|nr:CDP-alcohol phosphatidyltransferase family protein [Kofleriaceae bacterium]
MWLAHALTLSRIPIAVVFWLTYGQSRWLSLGLVVLAALTDAADGNVARYAKRRTGSQSTLGEWLDPAADKLFIVGVLGAIQFHDPVPWAIVALIVARELVVIPLATIYRFVAHGRGAHAFQAGVIGKAATIAEMLAIGAIILHSPALTPLAIAAAALGLTAVGLYIARATRPQPRLAT